jgi:hypothetical protein
MPSNVCSKERYKTERGHDESGGHSQAGYALQRGLIKDNR